MKTMKMIYSGLFAALLVAGCATSPEQPQQSQLKGFLGDYSKLESVKGEDNEEIRRWVTSSPIKGLYPKMIIDPIVFYPEPQPTAQASMETLQGLRRYADEAIRRELGKSYLLVNQVGPGVARVRIAMTGVSTDAEELQAYEYLPFTAIAAGVTSATGERDRVAFIMTEAEVTDSVTGEKLGMAVRKIPGTRLLEDDRQQLTVDMMKEAIDDKASNARLIFDRVLK